MCPYIASLGVNTKHRLEAFPIGVHRWPVTFHKKVVVSQPLRQVIVVHHHPPGCPHSPRKLFCLLKSSRRHGQEVQSAGFGIAWTLPRWRRLGFILQWQGHILPIYTTITLQSNDVLLNAELAFTTVVSVLWASFSQRIRGVTIVCYINLHFTYLLTYLYVDSHKQYIDKSLDQLTELRFYVQLNTKQVISETFFPANLLV